MTTLMRTNDIQKFVDEAFANFFNRDFPEASRGWTPPVDVAEDAETLTFTAEVPGFSRDEISISVEDGVLTISGERRQQEEGRQFHRVERNYGRFERNFTLPRNVDPDKIDASLTNGVLVLTLPKREEAKPRQIEIKAK